MPIASSWSGLLAITIRLVSPFSTHLFALCRFYPPAARTSTQLPRSAQPPAKTLTTRPPIRGHFISSGTVASFLWAVTATTFSAQEANSEIVRSEFVSFPDFRPNARDSVRQTEEQMRYIPLESAHLPSQLAKLLRGTCGPSSQALLITLYRGASYL